MQTQAPEITVGVDLGDRTSVLCCLDAAGEVTERPSLSTTEAALERYFTALPPARVVMEAGTHSPWVSRLVKRLGHSVVVANPAALRRRGRRKSDHIDAEALARWGRIDPRLLSPIRHRGEAAQADLTLIRSRDALVRTRTALINHVRGSVKSIGARLRGCSTRCFARDAREAIPESLQPALLPILDLIERVSQQIRGFDRQIEQWVEERYPETQRLQQVVGVGPLTALTYVLVLQDPERFTQSRSVGAYLGLVPRLRQSGARSDELAISKTGDRLLRRLLVGSAHYVLGPFGPDTDLRRWGLARASGGGKGAKKRAVVAVARKLAVLLHRLWVSDERYEPLRQAERVTAATAA